MKTITQTTELYPVDKSQVHYEPVELPYPKKSIRAGETCWIPTFRYGDTTLYGATGWQGLSTRYWYTLWPERVFAQMDDCRGQFDTRNLPEQYNGCIKAALLDEFDFNSITEW